MFLFSLCIVFLFSLPVVGSNASLNSDHSAISSEISFHSSFTFKIDIVSHVSSFNGPSTSFTLSAYSTSAYNQSYASGTVKIVGSLIQGNDNSLTVQFTPSKFYSSVIGCALTAVTATYSQDSSSPLAYPQYSSQSLTSFTMVGLNNVTSITVSKIFIKSSTHYITINFYIQGDLNLELNNNPNSTHIVQATGTVKDMNLSTSPDILNNILFYALAITIIMVIGIAITLVVLAYAKHNKRTTRHPTNFPPSTDSSTYSPLNISNENPVTATTQPLPHTTFLESIFCPNCGTRNNKTDSYCAFCGEKIAR